MTAAKTLLLAMLALGALVVATPAALAEAEPDDTPCARVDPADPNEPIEVTAEECQRRPPPP